MQIYETIYTKKYKQGFFFTGSMENVGLSDHNPGGS
jgi:hypothetical protein